MPSIVYRANRLQVGIRCCSFARSVRRVGFRVYVLFCSHVLGYPEYAVKARAEERSSYGHEFDLKREYRGKVAFAPRQGRGTASIASLFHMPTPSLADLEMTAGGNANAPQRTTRCKVNDAAKKNELSGQQLVALVRRYRCLRARAGLSRSRMKEEGKCADVTSRRLAIGYGTYTLNSTT
jgi:hypothetical protein